MTLQDVLSQLSAAQQALRHSSAAFDTAIAGLRQTLDAVAHANHAQGEAMDAVILATEEALRLYHAKEQ